MRKLVEARSTAMPIPKGTKVQTRMGEGVVHSGPHYADAETEKRHVAQFGRSLSPYHIVHMGKNKSVHYVPTSEIKLGERMKQAASVEEAEKKADASVEEAAAKGAEHYTWYTYNHPRATSVVQNTSKGPVKHRLEQGTKFGIREATSGKDKGKHRLVIGDKLTHVHTIAPAHAGKLVSKSKKLAGAKVASTKKPSKPPKNSPLGKLAAKSKGPPEAAEHEAEYNQRFKAISKMAGEHLAKIGHNTEHQKHIAETGKIARAASKHIDAGNHKAAKTTITKLENHLKTFPKGKAGNVKPTKTTHPKHAHAMLNLAKRTIRQGLRSKYDTNAESRFGTLGITHADAADYLKAANHIHAGNRNAAGRTMTYMDSAPRDNIPMGTFNWATSHKTY